MEWNGLSLERRERKEKKKGRKEKENLGNFNFGNAPVVYAEFRITGNYRLSAYPSLKYSQGILNSQRQSHPKRMKFFFFFHFSNFYY